MNSFAKLHFLDKIHVKAFLLNQFVNSSSFFVLKEKEGFRKTFDSEAVGIL